MDIVPVVHYMLLSGVNIADADYVTKLDKEGNNIYDEKKTKIIISEKAVISGYHTKEWLWRIPLNKNAQNINTNKILIQRPYANKAIAHAFELISTEKTIAYYHAATVFTTKETWTDAIQSGSYDTWPGINVKAMLIPQTVKQQVQA